MSEVFKMSEAVGTFSGPVATFRHRPNTYFSEYVMLKCLKKQQQKNPKQNKLFLSCNINRNVWTNALQPNQELEILEKLQAATSSQNCFNIFSIIIKTVWHFWLLNRKLINKFSCVVCAMIVLHYILINIFFNLSWFA